MLLDSFLDELARALSPSDSSFEQAVRRAARIGKILERDPYMEVAFTEVGGSCGKQTAIEPLNDADLFVYLTPGSWTGSRGADFASATVLREFENRVEHAYRSHVDEGRVRVRRQTHSLRLEPLGVGSISVDVVPLRWDGNRDHIVMVPDRETRGWRTTCVTRQHQLINDLDCPGRPVRRAIRLLKWWRTQHDLPLRSYAIEVLVLHAAYNGVRKHPRTLVCSVLDHIAATGLREPIIIPYYGEATRLKRAAVHIVDPALPENNVADNVDSSGRARVVRLARRSRAYLERVEDALSGNRHRTAERLFSSVFGDPNALQF